MESHVGSDYKTGLDPTPNRMYSSVNYTWLSPDPAQADIFNPQSMTQYSYAGNSPFTFTDPTGLQCNPGAECVTVTAQAPPEVPISFYSSDYDRNPYNCTDGPAMLGAAFKYSTYAGACPVTGSSSSAPTTTVESPAPPPQPPQNTSWSSYLGCVAGQVALLAGAGNNLKTTVFLGVGTVAGAWFPPLLIGFGPADALYETKLVLWARAICTEEGYGRP